MSPSAWHFVHCACSGVFARVRPAAQTAGAAPGGPGRAPAARRRLGRAQREDHAIQLCMCGHVRPPCQRAQLPILKGFGGSVQLIRAEPRHARTPLGNHESRPLGPREPERPHRRQLNRFRGQSIFVMC